MKFFIYHRPIYSVRSKEFTGDLIHIAEEQKQFSPDGHQWKIKCCNRSSYVYTRLVKMLRSAGMGDDMIYPLDGKRSVKDLITYINLWEKRQ